MVFWHLNDVEMLLSYSCDPEVALLMSLTNLEVMTRRPCLSRVAERAHNAEAIEAKELAFLAETKPAQLASWSHSAVRVHNYPVFASYNIHDLHAHRLVSVKGRT